MYLVYICIDGVRVGSFGVIYNYNIVYITCVEYCFLVKEVALYVYL